MRRVLYVCNEDRAVGGSSRSLADLLRSVEGEVEPILLIREEGPVADWFRSMGYQCLVVPFFRGTFNAKGADRALRFLPHALHRLMVQKACIKRVSKAMEGKIDLVHSNSSSVDIGLEIARKMGVPHLWHIREYLDLGLGMRPFPSWKSWKRKLQTSDGVVAISPGLFRHLSLEGRPNTFCIPDAVKSASSVVQDEQKEPFILFVSVILSDAKRPLEAVEIFRRADLPPQYRLLMLGRAPDALRGALNVPGVELIEEQVDLENYYRKASAVLVCTPYEGMGRVSVESMFYGCPVVARNSGGNADVLGGGRFGTLYNNVEEGAAALRRVVEQLPVETLKAAGEEAARNYSYEGYAPRILEVYDKLCRK